MLNRLGLAFTPEDHLTVGVLRSNSLDNVEFNARSANQHQMNPTHVLAGAADDFFDASSWRLGFNIQRRLRL